MLSWSFVRVRICIPGDIFLVHIDVLCGRFLGRKAIPIIAWEKKEKRINGMHSISNKNKLTQYLLMSHFKVWAINIHFLRWSSDLVWEWIREVRRHALMHGLPTMKAQREKKIFWMHKLFMCFFGESTNAKCQKARKWLHAFYFVWLAHVWGMTMAFRTSCFRNNPHRFNSYLKVWVRWQHLT